MFQKITKHLANDVHRPPLHPGQIFSRFSSSVKILTQDHLYSINATRPGYYYILEFDNFTKCTVVLETPSFKKAYPNQPFCDLGPISFYPQQILVKYCKQPIFQKILLPQIYFLGSKLNFWGNWNENQ